MNMSKFFTNVSKESKVEQEDSEEIKVNKLNKLLNSDTIHKWTISKRPIYNYASTIINDILKKRDNNMIYIINLTLLLNRQFKKHNIIIKRNGKLRTICNFIKVEFGGIESFIKTFLSDICKIIVIDGLKYVKLNNDKDIIREGWIYITNDSY